MILCSCRWSLFEINFYMQFLPRLRRLEEDLFHHERHSAEIFCDWLHSQIWMWDHNMAGFFSFCLLVQKCSSSLWCLPFDVLSRNVVPFLERERERESERKMNIYFAISSNHRGLSLRCSCKTTVSLGSSFSLLHELEVYYQSCPSEKSLKEWKSLRCLRSCCTITDRKTDDFDSDFWSNRSIDKGLPDNFAWDTSLLFSVANKNNNWTIQTLFSFVYRCVLFCSHCCSNQSFARHPISCLLLLLYSFDIFALSMSLRFENFSFWHVRLYWQNSLCSAQCIL